MQRVTISIDDELLAAVDQMVAKHGYQNRSEAIRDLARAGLAERHNPSSQGAGVAALVYL